MIAAFVVAAAMAASESLPLAGILDSRDQARLVRDVEAVLEANPAVLALHRAYLRERGPAQLQTAQPEVDAVLFDIMSRRMSTTRSLFSEENETVEGLGALTGFTQLTGAELLAADPRLAALENLDQDTMSRLLSVLAPGAATRPPGGTAFPELSPVSFESLPQTTPERDRVPVQAELRQMVSAHETLRAHYDAYLDILARFPEIERAAEVYWTRLDALSRTETRTPTTKPASASVTRPAPPAVPRPQPPTVPGRR